MKTQQLGALKESLAYPARTTIAAVLALLAARVLGLPESYWAPITAVLVVQSGFQASLTVSWQRLVGTAFGAAMGALAAMTVGRSVAIYGLGILVIGILSAALRLGQPANRFAAIAFSIVLLVVHGEAAWIVALHRFLEVSTGIVAGLVLSAAWPETPAESRA